MGLGANSFGQHFLDPTSEDAGAHLGGLLISTLWDVGLVGLGLLLVAFAILARRLSRALTSPDPFARSQAAGLSAALICALIAYQATNGFWFAYNWVLIGMAASVPVGLAVRGSNPRVGRPEDVAHSMAARSLARPDPGSTPQRPEIRTASFLWKSLDG
jgi:hypothetical protein